jgi:hypothetical protein
MITNNVAEDFDPEISGSTVVWDCASGLCVWDGSAVTWIEEAGSYVETPAISGSNIAYECTSDICVWDGSSLSEITDVSGFYGSHWCPDISDSNVVWHRYYTGDIGIFRWDGSSVTPIIDSETSKGCPAISGSSVGGANKSAPTARSSSGTGLTSPRSRTTKQMT